jgi:uncharacterized Zn finger protein (UPF0148 family)
MENVMYCKNCGMKLENGAKFCGRCGMPVDNEIFEHSQEEMETLVATSEENSATIQSISETIAAQNNSVKDDNDSQTYVKDSSDKYYVTDKDGNIVAEISQEGLKAVRFLNKSGKDIEELISQKADKDIEAIIIKKKLPGGRRE